MANVDLSGYNLTELKALQQDIEKAIKDRQHQDVQTARDQILAIARDAGISVEELLASPGKNAAKKEGKKVRPQYGNPANESQTWTGRGRQPKWISEGLASGKTLDQFRIK
jgi:DNA-binding protein H-NS